MSESDMAFARVYTAGKAISVLAGLVCLIALVMVYQAPLDAVQGLHQKIFYVHVSSAWTAYLMAFCMLVCALWVLAAKKNGATILKAGDFMGAATEVALVFLTIVTLTGPLWGKPVWGTWWSWDARLTSNFVFWLMLITGTMLWHSLPLQVRSVKMRAAFAVLTAANVPIVHFSVKWWRTLHPEPVVMQEKVGGGLDPAMVPALLVSLAGISLLGIGLWLIASVQAVRANQLPDLSTSNTEKDAQ